MSTTEQKKDPEVELAKDDIEKLSTEHAVVEPASPMSEDEKALIWKQDLRIIPLSAAIYFLCFLDRANIGNAKILNNSTKNDMQTETGMSNYQFTIALMVFLVAYGIFEVPSNILLKKLRPSRWIAILMFTWGTVTMCIGACNTFAQVTACRWLLGMAEAGLFPGLVYYLTFWYKHDERSVRVALILASATLAGAFGGAIAYGVGHMNGVGGHSGWRWLFILEGIPSTLSAFAVWFMLPDYPERASWLSQKEKDLAIVRLEVEGSKSHHRSMTWKDAKETLTDWRLYGHYVIYFGISIPFASMSLFSPSIIQGLGYKDLKAQLMTVPPWVVGYVVQIVVAYSADHYNARGYHIMAFAFVAALGYIVSAVLEPTAFKARYGCFILGLAGSFATIPPMLGWLTSFATIPPMLGWLTSNVVSTAAIGLAIAINVSVGAGFGQIGGVFIYKAEEREKGYPSGHWTNAAMLLVIVAGAIGLRIYYGLMNKKLLREANGAPVRLYKL